MNKYIKVALALCLTWALRSTASAAVSGQLTVTIVPNAAFSVTIDTGNVSLNLGTVDLGVATQTVHPSTVTINSTISQTDLKLQGLITAAAGAWTFDDNATSTESQKLAAWATFTSVARSSAPPYMGDYFSGSVPGAAGSDAIDANSRYVGSSATDSTSNLFENNTEFASKEMDAMAPDPDASAKSLLWLRFRLPSLTTNNNAQNITLTLTAVAID